jgi:hypothetical protein
MFWLQTRAFRHATCWSHHIPTPEEKDPIRINSFHGWRVCCWLKTKTISYPLVIKQFAMETMAHLVLWFMMIPLLHLVIFQLHMFNDQKVPMYEQQNVGIASLEVSLATSMEFWRLMWLKKCWLLLGYDIMFYLQLKNQCKNLAHSYPESFLIKPP